MPYGDPLKQDTGQLINEMKALGFPQLERFMECAAPAIVFNPIGGATQSAAAALAGGSVFKIPRTGLYEVHVSASGAASAAGLNVANMLISNGIFTGVGLGQVVTGGSSNNGVGSGVGQVRFEGGDSVILQFNWPGFGGAWSLGTNLILLRQVAAP